MKPTAKENKGNSNEHTKGWFSECMESGKQQLAKFLNRHSEKLSTGQKKLALLFMGILMGCISFMFILKPFQDSAAHTFRLPEGMVSNGLIIPPGEHDAMFTEEDYRLLLKFKSMLDSLYKVDRATYDQVLQGREGLLDSIDFLISIYK